MTIACQGNVEYWIDWTEMGRDHTLEVEVSFPVGDARQLVVFLPVWTPGSYLVREYARQVESITAVDRSQDIQIRKISKNQWLVTWTSDLSQVRLRYRLYAREKSVRTNWVEPRFAFLVGAATFITAKDFPDAKHRVCLQNLPPGLEVDCMLGQSNTGSEIVLVAHDYDELVDSPILIGDLVRHDFEVDGREHRLVSCGQVNLWDHATAARDTEKIVRTVQGFWGEVPYDRYSFQNLILGGYGGLEHDHCCVLMSEPSIMTDRASYLEWLGLVSHEFFHTWNVRRLRPQALRAYDYQAEQYVRELWIAEGITSYFDDLLVLRAGLCSESEFLQRLSKTIHTVMSSPGRNVQSLEESSFDTWIKLYRPDENSANSRISYYTKGAVVAWLLDLKLAEVSSFAVRLDDVMRELWQRYRTKGYTEEDFEGLVAELVPWDWTDWFDLHVRGISELDFTRPLEFCGIRWKSEDTLSLKTSQELAVCVPTEGAESVKPRSVTLGIETKDQNGRAVVTKILRGGAASRAGLQVDDEILAIDQRKVTSSNINAMIQRLRCDIKAEVSYFRREVMSTIQIAPEFGPREWKLEVLSEASSVAVENRKRWLAGSGAK